LYVQELIMGATKGPYAEEFPVGTTVRIVDRSTLERFRREWKFHNPLDESQFDFADRIATVAKVGFYHGGDELYSLKGIPGIWHERCLKPVVEPK
jgi:hypothetical protein